jgi:peptidoglycan/LPS O-acetylase OafA/YrhL
MRRLRRIFPPYWAALLLTASVVGLAWVCGFPNLLTDSDNSIPHPGMLTGQQWLGNLTLTETWRQHLSIAPPSLQLGPAWTLCYEEQFYAVCGLLLLLAPRRFFTGAAAVTALTLGVTVFSFVRPLPSIQGFFFDGRWLPFAAGVFVYYLLNYTAGTRRQVLFGLFCLATVLAAVGRYGLLAKSDSWEVKDRAFEIVVGAAFSLLLLVLHPWDKQLAGSRLLRPLTFCGTMCYSLYLVHWPVSKLISHVFFDLGVTGVWGTLAVTMPVAIAASVGVAWGFHRLVERQFLNSPATSSAPAPAMPALRLRPVPALASAADGR